MATLGEIYTALSDFRASLHQARFEESPYDTGSMAAFAAAAPVAQAQASTLPAFSSPLSNVHATGIGIRVRNGEVVPGEFVLKAFVFSKRDLGAATPDLMKSFGGVPVDVEQLPVQLALAKGPRAADSGIPPNRRKQTPIVGGVSIAPLDAPYVGTLGCFVLRRVAGIRQVFVLSNNHVLADVNNAPIGTQIVQPGAEQVSATPKDVFATLSEFVPIRFPTSRLQRVVNRFDAAIARVIDEKAIKTGSILGIDTFIPELAAAQPGMRVVKSGRTTGVTRGTVTSIGVNGVQVNYGTTAGPMIASFNDTVQIVGDGGQPFSLPGDSGSVILDERTGRPVALLFAGDGRTTTACNLAGVCRELNVLPI